MTAIARIPRAEGLPCIGRDWYRFPADETSGPYPCADMLNVTVLLSGSPTGRVGAQISGRNQVGPVVGTITPNDCSGLGDEYVHIVGYGEGGPGAFIDVDIDIWRAYQDGVWTSSITIDIYGVTGGSGCDLRASIRSVPTVYQDKTGITSTSSTPCSAVVLLGTITVNDDGTFSIA